eukprot:1262047-Rhodomonas_salina.2
MPVWCYQGIRVVLWHVPPIVLRVRYAVPGTDIGYDATHSLCSVRAGGAHDFRYDVLSAYTHAMRCPVLPYRVVLSAYSLAMQCPIPTYRVVLS